MAKKEDNKNSFNPHELDDVVEDSSTSDIKQEATESALNLIAGLKEGIIPFKPQLSAAATAAASLPTSLEELYKKYREAERLNQAKYEEIMSRPGYSAKIGEFAGMVIDPAAAVTAKGISSLAGKVIKPILGATKEEKALSAALKLSGKDEAEKLARTDAIKKAVENLIEKEKNVPLSRKLVEGGLTSAIIGGMYGGSRSKGELGEGEQASGQLLEDVGSTALASAITSVPFTVLGSAFGKYFGKGSKDADIRRAIAAKELESGERLGVPVNLSEASGTGKLFSEPEGPKIVLRDVEEKSKMLTDRVVDAFNDAKNRLNDLFKKYGKSSVNKNATAESEKLSQRIANAQGKAIKAYEKKHNVILDPVGDSNLISSIHREAAWNNGIRENLSKYHPELAQLVGHVMNKQGLLNLFHLIDDDLIPGLMGGEEISFSKLYNAQRKLKSDLSKYIDTPGGVFLNDTERNILFGKGDFAGSGILTNEIISKSNKMVPGLLERTLEKMVPKIDEYRSAVRDYASAPIEAFLNKNPDISTHDTMAWSFSDPQIRKKLESYISTLIEGARGTNIQGPKYSKMLDDVYDLMHKNETRNASPRKVVEVTKDILNLRDTIGKSSENFAALVGLLGKDQALGHLKGEDIKNIFKPVTLLEGATSLGTGRMIGKATRLKESIAEIPAKIPPKKINPLYWRNIGADKLKEMANTLSKSNEPWKANIGRAAQQALEENPSYRAVFLNQVAQNPALRAALNLGLTEEKPEEEKKFNPLELEDVK